MKTEYRKTGDARRAQGTGRKGEETRATTKEEEEEEKKKKKGGREGGKEGQAIIVGARGIVASSHQETTGISCC